MYRAARIVALAALPLVLACPPDEGHWPDDVPRPEEGEGEGEGEDPCSTEVPDGVCPEAQTCRGGQCLDDDVLCSATNPTGLCADEDESCLEGECVATAELCSATNLTGRCATDLSCHQGVCATDEPCAPSEPLGFCDAGQACLDGGCVDSTLLCSATNTDGLCRSGTSCLDGACIDVALLCSASQPAGACPSGEQCVGGACRTPEELCSATNPTGACPVGLSCVDGECADPSQACGCTESQTCIDGVCREPEQLCSTDNPNGLCEGGDSCVAGACVDLGAACSPQNQTGVCPPGELCHDGACEAVDGGALCDDDNECTSDSFDPVRNRCRNEARTGACDDGNECTNDSCVAGACTGTAIGGCIEPPVLEPVVSPTNVGSLTLRGTKPAGSSVQINGLTAVPENPDEEWQVTINLVPGDNAFVVRSVDQGNPSATREVHVVYDITPPLTRVTPEGGSFLSGVTATIASNEPATVYFTTDGSEPTTSSPSFTSLKQLRIFADTRLRMRARDVAGNLEEEIVSVDFEISGRQSGWSTGPALAEPTSLAGATVIGAHVFVAGGTDGLAPQAGAYQLDVDSGDLTTLPSLSGARDSLAMAAVGSTIYAIAGQNAGTPLNRVERLTDGAASWETRAPMPSTRHSLAAIAVGSRIFVFGGKGNGGAVLTNLEVYDTGANTWSNAVAQLPHARAGHGAVMIDDLIYLVGGMGSDGAPLADVDVYDPAGNTWSSAAPLPTPRSYLGVTAIENAGQITSGPKGLVAAGGLLAGGVATATVEEYDIELDAWRLVAPLPAARHSAAAVTVIVSDDVDTEEQEGWLLGGQVGADIVDSGLRLRSTRDYVRRLPDLPEARFLAAAAALDDRIYVLGGRNFSEVAQGWAFDPETGAYEELPPLASLQNGPGAVAVGDRVYLVGGADGFGNSVATNRAWDPALHEWVELAPMTSARRDVAAVALGTEIYVIGGDNGGPLQTVEIYDTVANTWRTGSLLPQPRRGAMAVLHGGKVHVLGGETSGGTAATSVLRLDGTSWTTLSGSIGVAYGAAFSLHDRIAVFAGRVNGTVGNDVVDYRVSAQTVAAPRRPEQLLSPALDRRAAALYQGRIYLFGGNASEAIGPSGEAIVEEIDARCFNGVLDGRETAGGMSAADFEGGCPTNGYVHHTGTGITFVNDLPNDTSSLQGALDACNAHFGGGCERVDCGTCTDVTKPLASGQSCNCSVTGPDWIYGHGGCLDYGANGPGTVTGNDGDACAAPVIGAWD